MEEDIKILEEIKKKFEKTMKIIVLGEYSTYVDNSIFEDIKKLINISENLIARYKQLEEENKSKQKAYDDCYCEYKHYKQFDSIPTSLIKEKIEELKKKVEELTDEKGYWGGSDLLEQIKVLQELLREE